MVMRNAPDDAGGSCSIWLVVVATLAALWIIAVLALPLVDALGRGA